MSCTTLRRDGESEEEAWGGCISMVSVAAVGCSKGVAPGHGRREQQPPGRRNRGATWGLGVQLCPCPVRQVVIESVGLCRNDRVCGKYCFGHLWADLCVILGLKGN